VQLASGTRRRRLPSGGGRLVEIRVVKRSAAASVATALEKLSVRVDDVPRTRLLVEAVHILRADEKALLQRVFKVREGEVGRIRLGCRSNPPPHGIELPHQPGIAVPSCGRSGLLVTVNERKRDFSPTELKRHFER